jgi:hypothetical protein
MIPPALTPWQWETLHSGWVRVESLIPILTTPEDMPAIIAVANNALMDDEQRKITHHHAWIVRTLADHVDTQHPGGIKFRREALALADILTSYLPPIA